MISEEGIFNLSAQLLPKEEMLAIANEKTSIVIGVLVETDEEENRVCLSPESVGLLVENGHRIFILTKAGEKAGFSDMEYSEQGAQVMSSVDEVMQAQVILKVSPLNHYERNYIRKNQLIITSLQVINRSREFFP